MTYQEIIETLAAIKNCKPSEIKELDIESTIFHKGNSIFMFDFTPSGKMIKSNSVKFFCTASDFQNCSY